MSSIDDRREGFEKKFALDEELRFKATARRNKLLGLWAAEKLGRQGAEAETYARSVVVADFEEIGDGDVIRKVLKDLEEGGRPETEATIRSKLDELMARAVTEIQTGA